MKTREWKPGGTAQNITEATKNFAHMCREKGIEVPEGAQEMFDGSLRDLLANRISIIQFKIERGATPEEINQFLMDILE